MKLVASLANRRVAEQHDVRPDLRFTRALLPSSARDSIEPTGMRPSARASGVTSPRASSSSPYAL